MDEKLKRYAEWLEGFLRSLVTYQPNKIGVVCLMDSGESLTGFYGDLSSGDKGMMAYHIAADGIMDEVYDNARNIIRTAKEQEEQHAE